MSVGTRLRNASIYLQWYLEAFKVRRMLLLFGVLLLLWLVGAGVILAAEHTWHAAVGGEVGYRYDNYATCLWGSTVYLVSGLDEEAPDSPLGRLVTIFMMIVPAGVLVGAGTFFVAAFNNLTQLNRFVKECPDRAAFRGHIVICGWSPKGDQIVRQLHSADCPSRRRRAILIISPTVLSVPVTDESAYRDVWGVPQDPVDDDALRRHGHLDHAQSVVILAVDEDGGEGRSADSRTILTALAVKAAGASSKASVEVVWRKNERHFRRSEVREQVCVGDLSGRLIAHAARNRGLTRFYGDLLEISRQTNEVYFMRVPRHLRGLCFAHAWRELRQWLEDDVVLLGFQQGAANIPPPGPGVEETPDAFRITDLTINPPHRVPKARDRGPGRVDRDYRLQANDTLVVLARKRPDFSTLT